VLKVVPLSRSAVGMGEFSGVGTGVSVGIGVWVEVGAGDGVGVQVEGKTGLGVGLGVQVRNKAGIVVGGYGFRPLCGLIKMTPNIRATTNVPATKIPDSRFRKDPGLLFLRGAGACASSINSGSSKKSSRGSDIYILPGALYEGNVISIVLSFQRRSSQSSRAFSCRTWRIAGSMGLFSCLSRTLMI